MNPPKAERAKPSLSSDYNLLFKNKIGESSLDIHRGHATALAYSVTECGLSAFPTAIDLETDPYLGTNGKWTGGAFPEILPGLEQIEKDALLPGVSLRKNKPL